ncbi:MAG: TIGR03663 family protein [Armatimonadetes bacterium]|nr:TIGR03663 family protein [Armatimonadota bacterium]
MESVEPRAAQRAWLWSVGLIIATVLALLLRLPELDTRLIHADESVHAMRYQEVLHGTYRYDPNEYHGPTLYYATLPLNLLRGRTDFGTIGIADYRLVTIVFGLLLIWAMPFAMPGVPRSGAVVAGLLVALSPVLAYYSRYYIQEMLLAVFTVAFLGALYRAAERRDGRWLVASGLLAGLMVATKETATLSFAAALVALLAARAPKADGAGIARRHWLWAIGLFALTAFALLSGLGHAPGAPFAFLRSVATWGQRATGGEMHQQPAIYYLRLLAWAKLRGGFYSEGFILALAVLGALLTWRRSRWTRFVTVYSMLITAAYSAIPYKTPWCVVQLVTPYIMLAGAGAAALLGSRRWWVKLPVALLLLAGLVHLGFESQRINHRMLMDRRNPYSHTLTAPDVEDLADQIEKVARSLPTGTNTMVVVMGMDNYYWPLPWYLRRLPNIGWFNHLPSRAELKGDLTLAPIIVAAPQYQNDLTPRIGFTHESIGTYGLRSRVFFELWVNKRAWTKLSGPASP